MAIIADDGEALVLAPMEGYRRLTRRGPSLADALHRPGAEDIGLATLAGMAVVAGSGVVVALRSRR